MPDRAFDFFRHLALYLDHIPLPLVKKMIGFFFLTGDPSGVILELSAKKGVNAYISSLATLENYPDLRLVLCMKLNIIAVATIYGMLVSKTFIPSRTILIMVVIRYIYENR